MHWLLESLFGQKFDEWSKENLQTKSHVERLGLSPKAESETHIDKLGLSESQKKSHVESVLQSRDGYTGQSVS